MDTAPADAAPSRIRELIPNPPASRRTMVKGLGAAAIAATLVPFDWALSRRAATARVAPSSEWTDPHCGGVGGYDGQSSNWWEGPAVCYGGWRRGGRPCNAENRHWDGHFIYSSPWYEDIWSQRSTNYCNTRNAWRWSTPSGNTFRCSDAWTHIYWDDGTNKAGLTIAVCFVGVYG
ncbi:hypothetical protein [Actinomadura alba]|uniref:Twin-arginine translocation signal domain-containing protein n=1 Tax=Actinomadura alba TaxID=406431 RepID=A0ABR7LGJ8_9ACTN|nr:hypothetical protein [Actinomadura alba]MBC6463956.1 hypothetical protein [Actinomadura alba]